LNLSAIPVQGRNQQLRNPLVRLGEKLILPLFIHQSTAVFANPLRLAIHALDFYSARLIAARTNEHDIRDIDRGLKFDDARLQCPALGLILALVAFTDINTLDRDPPLLWQHFDHFAPFSFIITMSADDFNDVTSTNF
jgi:hypothetical protein